MNERVKVYALHDGENNYYHTEAEDLARHIAQLCKIGSDTKIVINTLMMDRAELERMPEVDIEL